MPCCKSKGNIIFPPIVIMPQPPPIQRQIIPSSCSPPVVPYFNHTNNYRPQRQVQNLQRYPKHTNPYITRQHYNQYPTQRPYYPQPAAPYSNSKLDNDSDYSDYSDYSDDF